MKRTFVALALILAGASTASAQGYGYGNPGYRGHAYNPYGPRIMRPVHPPVVVIPSHRHYGYNRSPWRHRPMRPWHPYWR